MGFTISADYHRDSLTEDFIDELFHYGIKGMHWGVRRSDAQLALVHPESGHTTNLRYNPKKTSITVGENGKVTSISSKSKKDYARVQKQIDSSAPTAPEAARTQSTKRQASAAGIHTVSNKELQDAVSRMELENKFSKAVSSTKKQSAGRKFLTKLIAETGAREISSLAAGKDGPLLKRVRDEVVKNKTKKSSTAAQQATLRVVQKASKVHKITTL